GCGSPRHAEASARRHLVIPRDAGHLDRIGRVPALAPGFLRQKMFGMRLPGLDGGFVWPVGQRHLVIPFAHGMEFKATELRKRQLAHAGSDTEILVVERHDLRAEDDNVHGASLPDSARWAREA